MTTLDADLGGVAAPGAHRALRSRRVLAVLAIALVALFVLACGTGAVRIGPLEVLGILCSRIGLELPVAFEPRQAAVLLEIRLPRVVLGALVGAALALAGAVMQGVFRNPLADPGLLGVSSGAALATAALLVFGARVMRVFPPGAAAWILPGGAFAGSIAATIAVSQLARGTHGRAVATTLLAGIAVNALASAGTGWLTFVATDAQARTLTFWTLGSLGGATWPAVIAVSVPLSLSVLLLARLARPLNALLLGEAEAGHLGVDVRATHRAAIVLVSVAVGASVALTGVIAFVGLVVPHLLRLVVGPDHRTLLPGSALAGASLLVSADLVARTAVAPAELPVGIVTSLVGAPFFLWLLRREARGIA